MLPGQLECHKICLGLDGGMRPYPRLREQEWEVEGERGRALCNPYYMLPRARELFKKPFVVLSFGSVIEGWDEGGRSYSLTDYVISIKRLKIEDWRIMISIFKECKIERFR